MMGIKENMNSLTSNLVDITWRCLLGILSMGPIPDHIAFIMDGNRRYAKRFKLEEGEGYKLGFTALTSMLKYCYMLDVKYITVYAFSIDNFKRRPEEVKSLMELICKKIEGLIKQNSIVNQYGLRVHFAGDLKLLDDSVRLAAEKAMAATACNSRAVLSICIAYTSTNEIVNAVEQSCKEKRDELRTLESCCMADGLASYACNGKMKKKNSIHVMDVEKYMYVAPSPDIVVRTSGDNRLSNFLLWQSTHSILYSPSVLWPEIGLRNLVWAVLNFQRNPSCLEKNKKQHQ